jgi:hypothetical protein
MARKVTESHRAGHETRHESKRSTGRDSLRDHVAARHEGKTHEQPRNPKTGRFVKAR